MVRSQTVNADLGPFDHDFHTKPSKEECMQTDRKWHVYGGATADWAPSAILKSEV